MESKIRASAGGSQPLVGGRYTILLGGVLVSGILFTIADFVTSYVALNEGFVEGNALLTGLSGSLRLGTLESMLLMKAVFILGMSLLALVGLRSEQRGTKKLMLASVTVFMVLFACVSLNNLYWITS